MGSIPRRDESGTSTHSVPRGETPLSVRTPPRRDPFRLSMLPNPETIESASTAEIARTAPRELRANSAELSRHGYFVPTIHSSPIPLIPDPHPRSPSPIPIPDPRSPIPDP